MMLFIDYIYKTKVKVWVKKKDGEDVKAGQRDGTPNYIVRHNHEVRLHVWSQNLFIALMQHPQYTTLSLIYQLRTI